VNAVVQGRPPAVIPYEFDFHNPDYCQVNAWRGKFLQRIRERNAAPQLFKFYQENPIQFIVDWGMTFEPRNPEIGLPSKIPFVLFPKQIDWAQWILDRWRSRERGMTLKSRGSGMSWLAVSLATTLCLFNRGLAIGFGSRTADYVDELGDPKSLLEKVRMFLRMIPEEFRFGWNEYEHSRKNRIFFPHTESTLTGEVGDNIGRGNRTSLYFVDEAGFLEHPEMAEASLSDTTNCRIDISTSPGANTVFADRYEALPERQKYFFHWKDDSRRGAEWLKQKIAEIPAAIFEREFEGSLDAYGSFFNEADLLVDGQPVEMPTVLQDHFAVIDSANKSGMEHDGLAVVHMGRRPADLVAKGESPLVILSWHLTQIDAAFLINWLPGVFDEEEQLAKECRSLQGSLGVWIEDKASGIVLLQQAKNLGLNASPIHTKLTALGKAERGINISGYIHRGECKITRRAYEKTVTYKGVTKNHLLSQILSFRAGVKDQKQDDAYDAWCYAVAIGMGNQEGF
jgi:hypothetical protein